ncbi:hypothetical protein K461DRAFT_269940 [Myriangium duriaei CBS 260.36]|uniref:Uncharacterized protein n=1 Tax=Myriangium duriaei CBS 260.36 TaxID=1168546 RepID=A0A9P4IZ68_9PEZI|nr:hypothetical protein K461DRAFT_269940 [Myriangium duriaei CBS 260.36]
MDSAHRRSENEPPMPAPGKPAKSPPMAFQMTSNDSLNAPRDYTLPSQLPFQQMDYLTSTSAGYGTDYDVSSPMELDLQGQVHKQVEALRLQHQAFVVERECWNMERDRLYKRIAALEALLKSPKGPRSVLTPPDRALSGTGSHRDSPSKSPEMTPSTNGVHAHAPAQRTSSNSSRLPSIAEHDANPVQGRKASFKRDNAPRHINIPPEPSVQVNVIPDVEDPLSPPATGQILSPPPPEYLRNAGHTPIRIASRPTSSHSQGQAELDDTPTRRNTARNLALPNEVDDDPGLSGPLRLPELPTTPGDENFTIDALTARLQYIEEHPDESEPLALSAKPNRDDESDVDTSDHTIKPVEEAVIETKETPLISQSLSSAAEMSPPPASEASQTLTPQDRLQDRGIKLKTKASMNFGAPLGKLRP